MRVMLLSFWSFSSSSSLNRRRSGFSIQRHDPRPVLSVSSSFSRGTEQSVLVETEASLVSWQVQALVIGATLFGEL